MDDNQIFRGFLILIVVIFWVVFANHLTQFWYLPIGASFAALLAVCIIYGKNIDRKEEIEQQEKAEQLKKDIAQPQLEIKQQNKIKLENVENMKLIKSNAELELLHSVGEGLIYNDYSGKGSPAVTWNVLHAAYCHWLNKDSVNAPTSRIPKYFFSDVDTAIAWLRKNRGEEGKNWKRCGTCKAKTQM